MKRAEDRPGPSPPVGEKALRAACATVSPGERQRLADAGITVDANWTIENALQAAAPILYAEWTEQLWQEIERVRELVEALERLYPEAR